MVISVADEKPKRKQKKKKGIVVRLQPDLEALVTLMKEDGETYSDVIRRLFEQDDREIRYALPSDLHESPADAKGAAVTKAVRARTKVTERPVKVLLK